MTRILSYNILVGGTPRIEQISKIIASAEPDIVGLVEATNPKVVEELAKRLDMQYVLSGNAQHWYDWHVALLTRFPIRETKIYIHPDRVSKPVFEVCVEEPDGQRLTIFVTHLSAAFSQGRAGDQIRRREVRELLRIMAKKQGTPHLVMGDFNSLAPGDHFQASKLLEYIVELDRTSQDQTHVNNGHPNLNFVVPSFLQFLEPVLRLISRNKRLHPLFDWAGEFYAPRGTIALLRAAGYIDCFRYVNPGVLGFTCPAAAPAGRIDYIFASPELTERLARCEVILAGEGVRGDEASDHLPIIAEFGQGVNLGRIEEDEDRKRVEVEL